MSKTDIKTQSMSKKKDVILHRKKRMSFNFLIKTVLKKTSNWHLQHGES